MSKALKTEELEIEKLTERLLQSLWEMETGTGVNINGGQMEGKEGERERDIVQDSDLVVLIVEDKG